MERPELTFGKWGLQCIPGDGARISRLRFAGVDLLTREPVDFRPPSGDFEAFELRPVYGYDDCFPSVDICRHPVGFDVPDHGELVWLGWDVTAGEDRLTCRTTSELLPVTFTRELVFAESSLQWRFEVRNASAEAVPFMHVMHGLMPPTEIVGLRLPVCDDIVDEGSGNSWGDGADPASEGERLVGLEAPAAEMLLMRGCRRGAVDATLRSGLTLAIEWPVELLPTLGIWWNVGGYPEATGLSRHECAFEPMAGTWSSLERSLADSDCQTVPAEASTAWSISWSVRR